MKPIKPRDLLNYLKNNRRMDQDALIEYILSALSDGEFIYGPEESSLVMEYVAAKSETLPIVRLVDRFCI